MIFIIYKFYKTIDIYYKLFYFISSVFIDLNVIFLIYNPFLHYFYLIISIICNYYYFFSIFGENCRFPKGEALGGGRKGAKPLCHSLNEYIFLNDWKIFYCISLWWLHCKLFNYLNIKHSHLGYIQINLSKFIASVSNIVKRFY